MSERPVYTNKHRLPEEVVKAVMKDRYTDDTEEAFDLSASTLCTPTQKIILERRYKGRLKIFDVVDKFASFLGTIAHHVLEEAWHESMGSVSERRLYMNVLGETIAGKMDIYHEGAIRDYKVTKIYKVNKKDFYDWEVQLNIYAQLCRAASLPVKELKVICMLSDWTKGQVRYKNNYPEAPIVIIPLRLWSEEEAKGFIWTKVEEIIHASSLSDTELAEKYPCSDYERWANIEGYAVIKPGAKKAYKKFDSHEEAANFLAEIPEEKACQYLIETRKSEPTRCIDWCDCANVCHQWRKEKGEPIIGGKQEAETPLF